jgi:hypothetical protein
MISFVRGAGNVNLPSIAHFLGREDLNDVKGEKHKFMQSQKDVWYICRNENTSSFGKAINHDYL